MKKSFFARNAFTIILVTVFAMPICFGAARFALTTNTNDVKQWLPESYAETQQYHRFRRSFEGEEFILISWDGCTLEDDRLPLLAAKLVPPPEERSAEDGPPLFKKVITGPSVVDLLTSEPTNLSYEQAVERMAGTLIGHDLSTTCAVLTLSEAGKLNLHKTIAKVRDTAANECAIPLDSQHMGGPPVDNVAIDVAGQESLYRLAGLAGLIGLVISWWCLRTWRLIIMVFATAIYSGAASLAVVYWTGNSLNAILLTMPPLVYVAATSGAIHLSNYYRDTAKELGVEGAPGRALRHAILPITLATITTSVGLLSLCYSELVPIQMFGLYSAIGVGISMLLLTVWMPAALTLFPLPQSAIHAADAPSGVFDPLNSSRWETLGRWIIGHHWLVSAGCLTIFGLAAWGLTQIQTSVQLMRLFDSKARILADYKWLEENLGELIPMEVVIKVDEANSKLTFLEQMELVSRIQRRVDGIEEVGSSLSCVTFAPDIPISDKPKGRRGFREITERNVRNKRLDEHRQDFLAGDYLRQADGSLLWRISARVGALKDVDYHRFIEDIKGEVEPVLAEERERLKAAGVKDPSVVQATYTGLVPLVYKAQRSLLDGLILGFVGDLIVVTLVMMIAVREWSAGLVLSLPSIFPAVIVFGVMGWTGIVVDVGTVMAPAVALGVTVDDVVHFMLWYREGLKQGLSRHEAIMLAYKGCARAMYQSWGVIGLGLAVFALSPFQPTQRFGYLMVTLLTAALVGNLLLLPTLLAGPLGLLFGLRLRKQAQQRKQEPGHVPAPHDLHGVARADAPHRLHQ